MASVSVSPELLGQIINLIFQVGVPEAIKLLARLKEDDITAAKVRALRAGLNPPVNSGEGS